MKSPPGVICGGLFYLRLSVKVTNGYVQIRITSLREKGSVHARPVNLKVQLHSCLISIFSITAALMKPAK